jgi:hypothetical protein
VGKGCRSESDSKSNIRLADCEKALQSLNLVNRVKVTVSARARCSRRVCNRVEA